ncbi:hypothetical protein BJF92_16685 [Rhizobium rhizosphaerae]|uniref:Uncharacterized protein n=1 Tax=Xaviernesmea rhizosphaerae TaxID=1672749 RepID=A0A1Q9AIE9_9HYPH|nr:hypothetical protein BJF92_16685 [Xaviernesmea rhizosphaerae]
MTSMAKHDDTAAPAPDLPVPEDLGGDQAAALPVQTFTRPGVSLRAPAATSPGLASLGLAALGLPAPAVPAAGLPPLERPAADLAAAGHDPASGAEEGSVPPPAPETGYWSFQLGEGDEAAQLDWRLDAAGMVTGLFWCGKPMERTDPLLHLADLPRDAQGRAFPATFRFDPATGQKLTHWHDATPLASFPRLAPDGFPVLPLAGQPVPAEKSEVHLPQGTVAVFSAGTPVRLFCLTRHGELHLRQPDGAWTWCDSLAQPGEVDHAFGVLGFATGFALVLAGHALVCRLRPGMPGLVHHRLKPEPGRRLCGAPALIDPDSIAFPVQRDETVGLMTYAIEAGGWAEEMEAGPLPLEAGEMLALPVQTASRQPETVWVGSSGALVTGFDFQSRVTATRPFGPDIRAVAGALPLREESGTLHALVSTPDCYGLISLTATPRLTELHGLQLCAGQARYSGRSFYPSLWSDSILELGVEAGAGSALLPLAYQKDARGAVDSALVILIRGLSGVDRLFARQGDAWLAGDLYWQSGSRLKPLEISLRLRARYDIIVFCEGDALVVGSALNGLFRRLPFEVIS